MLLAYKKQSRELVYPSDVKVAYYGFTPRSSGKNPMFSRVDIGCKRYNVASVCIARAFGHLARKGLVDREFGYGVTLTLNGREAVEALVTANLGTL